MSTSTFENLNHGRNITHLSLVEDKYHSTGVAAMSDVEDASSDIKQYPYFDNHGAVLNAEGFPGEIYFNQNTIKHNMYFIRDVFPSYRSKQDSQTLFEYFKSSDQVQMIKCATDGTKKRFFGDYLNANTP